MAIVFPSAAAAALQTPIYTFSPTSTPLVNTVNSTTYVYDVSRGAWTAAGNAPTVIAAATLAEAAAGTLNTVYSSPETAVPKDAAGMTGAALLPAGTTAQRPAAPVSGMARVNTDTNPQLEQYANGAWQPIGVITNNLTLNVATTGNDTTGLGTVAAPWATPHRAMEYLSQYAIKQGVTVTVSVADGSYTFTTPLNLNHPNGSQIFINGGSTTGARPAGAALNGGGGGNTAGTESFNDALLKAYYNTQWQFNNCHGLVCDSGGNVTVNTVLIRGNATPWIGVFAGNSDAATSYASSGGINLGTTVAVHNFGGNNIETRLGGSIGASSVTSTNSGFTGFLTNSGGYIRAGSATSSNNGVYGYLANYGGSIYLNSGEAYNNAQEGIVAAYGGNIRAENATSSGSGSLNVRAEGWGGIFIAGGNTGGSLSPAANTVGNGNAIIVV